MTDKEKVKRLSKVAKELNVGINTIVDFLSSKGVSLDSSPNTKIEAHVYELLVNEYQDDQYVKEQSKTTSLKKPPRETITLDDAKEEDNEVKPEGEDNIELVLDENDNLKIETSDAEETNTKDSPEKSGPKILGKIDLESHNKTKSDSKKETPKKEEKDSENKSEESSSTKGDETEKNPEHTDEESKTIKAKSEKLTGPTILGKIDIPEKKTPEKGNADFDREDRKKKRKRIKKVNLDKTQQKSQPSDKFSKKGRVEKAEISEEEIQKEIKETLARLSGGGKNKSAKLRRAKRDAISEKKQLEIDQEEKDKSVLKLTEFVTVSELASMMNTPVNELIAACMSLGIFVSINQRIEADIIQMIAEEFGYSVEFISSDIQEFISQTEDKEDDLVARPPIVTVMGHVDHGKTSLLDHIRKANVIAGEAGGITQHIGAYSVELEDKRKITFLDTPGHEAFTAMRARGAQVTDVVIIVIAADDNIMPQTVEAINHAQAAGVPMVFAINKIDKPGANPDKVKEELANMNILVEEWGGKYQSQDISAKQGLNVSELLEKVLLEAELLELKANPNKNAVGTIIESSLDKGRGYVTTILVEGGTLKVGDMMLAGQNYGRIKAMHNERGNPVKEAGPSTPVTILGLNGAPSSGDKFNVLDDEREVKQIATKREQLQREQGIRTQKHITLDEISRRLAIGDFKELNVIVKGDVDGSIEALSDSLIKLSTEEIQVNVIHKAVGQITESDVLLASASNAVIIGFQVRPSAAARKIAENEKIDIRIYSVIYKAIEELRDAMEGMLSPDKQEKIIGTAEIRETFKISKVGTIAGCFVIDGKILRNAQVRVIRDGIVVYTGLLGSLKRFKDDVKEVSSGYECGLNIDKFNDIKVGDVVESFEEVDVAKKLK